MFGTGRGGYMSGLGGPTTKRGIMRLRQVTLAVSIAAIGTIFGSIDAKAVQCAIFARGETGVDLYGDAWRWWGQAERAYARGAAPKPGALLVFKRANGMQHGHVAVVTK